MSYQLVLYNKNSHLNNNYVLSNILEEDYEKDDSQWEKELTELDETKDEKGKDFAIGLIKGIDIVKEFYVIPDSFVPPNNSLPKENRLDARKKAEEANMEKYRPAYAEALKKIAVENRVSNSSIGVKRHRSDIKGGKGKSTYKRTARKYTDTKGKKYTIYKKGEREYIKKLSKSAGKFMYRLIKS